MSMPLYNTDSDNISHTHRKPDGSLSDTQISTHLLYPSSNLPISLLAPMVEPDYSQETQVHHPDILQTKPQEQAEEKNPTEPPSVEIDGIHYNNRGYEICGQLNQHSKPCQRIGSCPFHKKLKEKQQKTKKEKTEKEEKNTCQEKIEKTVKKPGKKPPVKKGPYKRGWTKEEHILFLNGLQIHGKGAWKEISTIVQTRTPTQIQSHAQKYFLRQKQEVKNKRSIHDISLEDLHEMGPESIRSLSQAKTTLPNVNRNPQSPYGYPVMAQFPQEHLSMILNPLHPVVSSNPMSPSFQMPYQNTHWLPQIYPFGMPLSLNGIHDDSRNLQVDLGDERSHLSGEPTHTFKPEELPPLPKVGEKRTFDSFSFHNYSSEEKSPSKVIRTDNEFFFS